MLRCANVTKPDVNIFNCVGRQTLQVAASRDVTIHLQRLAGKNQCDSLIQFGAFANGYSLTSEALSSLSTNGVAMDYANHVVLRTRLRRSMQSQMSSSIS